MVLVNSNPATIMTDPELAERTYIEPLDLEHLEGILAREAPDALLPTLGGQTGLNLAMALHEEGILQKYGVELIGAKAEAIRKGEDREAFQEAMQRIGSEVPRGQLVGSVEEGLHFAREVGFPVVVRPSFTLGGTGAGSPTTRRSSWRSFPAASPSPPSTPPSWRSRSWAGRSLSWR